MLLPGWGAGSSSGVCFGNELDQGKPDRDRGGRGEGLRDTANPQGLATETQILTPGTGSRPPPGPHLRRTPFFSHGFSCKRARGAGDGMGRKRRTRRKRISGDRDRTQGVKEENKRRVKK